MLKHNKLGTNSVRDAFPHVTLQVDLPKLANRVCIDLF